MSLAHPALWDLLRPLPSIFRKRLFLLPPDAEPLGFSEVSSRESETRDSRDSPSEPSGLELLAVLTFPALMTS